MDNNMATKPAVHSSVATNASTPAALGVDVSSMKGKKAAFQTTKGLMLAPGIEQEWVSPKKAALGLQSGNEKADEELTPAEPAAKPITDEKLKIIQKRSDRQESRRARIPTRRPSGEDTQPPSFSGQNVISPSQEANQDDEDRVGAARVPGPDSGLTVMSVQETHVVPEAKIVDEEDIERLNQEEREQIEEATRQKIERINPEEREQIEEAIRQKMERVNQEEREKIEEATRQKIEQINQEEREKNEEATRRRALLCAAIVVILLGIIIGSVLGTRDKSQSVPAMAAPSLRPSPSPFMKPSQTPPVAPLNNNSLCDEPLPIMLGASATAVSLQDAAQQYVDFCEDENKSATFQPGLWYSYLHAGQDQSVIARTSGGVDLHVYPACDQIICDDLLAIYGGSSSSSAVAWTAESGVEYMLLVTSTVFSSGLPGNITVSIATRLATLSDLFVDYNVSIEALQNVSSPQYAALAWMANFDSTLVQATLSDDELVERFVMVLLYFANGGPNWSDQSRFLSPSLNTCSWRSGVHACNDEGSIVTLSLYANGLSGSLPTEIGLLSSLQSLGLYINDLTGTVPSQLGTLSSLEELFLYSNKFTGPIPSELGQISTLRELLLEDNLFTGTLPSQLGTMSALRLLWLYTNKFTGPIPSELGQMPTLQKLSLYDNALTGTLPSELGQISTLTSLALYHNALTGTLPSQLGTLSSLEIFYLYENMLTGQIPSELGQISTLRHLSLYSNDFTGSLPSELGHVLDVQFR